VAAFSSAAILCDLAVIVRGGAAYRIFDRFRKGQPADRACGLTAHRSLLGMPEWAAVVRSPGQRRFAPGMSPAAPPSAIAIDLYAIAVELDLEPGLLRLLVKHVAAQPDNDDYQNPDQHVETIPAHC
jgi:hypothetical protein